MSIDSFLAKMRTAGKMQDPKLKGSLGEEAVFELCANRSDKCILYNSFMYPYQTSRSGVVYTGNIKYEDGQFVDYTDKSLNDEIDILFITALKVFVIEVKSYSAYRLDVYDHWMNNGNTPVDKSPITQAEKHARHLYHAIYDVLPDGDPMYIVPIVCFVDHCTLRDDRSEYFRAYIPVCVLNNLNRTINKYNTPGPYNLSISDVQRKLKNVAVSIKKEA